MTADSEEPKRRSFGSSFILGGSDSGCGAAWPIRTYAISTDVKTLVAAKSNGDNGGPAP